MLIKKINNEYNGYDINLIDEDKVLSIKQTGDDYTWVMRLNDYSHITEEAFDILESDEVYPLFVSLYERIVTGNVLGQDINSLKVQEEMDLERNTSWYKRTVDDGVITIMCDAYPIAVPNILTISKDEGVIHLGFKKVESDKEPKSKFCISINIRQSGSRIYDLANPFKLLFRELQSIKESDIPMKKMDTKNR